MEQSQDIKNNTIKCLTFWMIPHIIQERSVEQDIHHPGEAAPRTPILGGRGAAEEEEEEEENVPSEAAEENLSSSTERWRESKAPPVTSADLDLCASKQRVPMQIHPWTPLLFLPRALSLIPLSFLFSFFPLLFNCCCFGWTFISHFLCRNLGCLEQTFFPKLTVGTVLDE